MINRHPRAAAFLRILRRARLAATALAGLLGACQGSFLPSEGGLHHQGDRMLSARGFHADPLVGRSAFWIGEANMPNNGVGIQNHWFVEDRVAIGLGMNYTVYDTSHSDADYDETWAFDIEARLRYYALEVAGAGTFLDLFGGWTHGDKKIPPEGTKNNGLFGAGVGVDIPLGAGFSLLTGMDFHHISNARGRYADDNPSQNELLFWGGVGVKW